MMTALIKNLKIINGSYVQNLTRLNQKCHINMNYLSNLSFILIIMKLKNFQELRQKFSKSLQWKIRMKLLMRIVANTVGKICRAYITLKVASMDHLRLYLIAIQHNKKRVKKKKPVWYVSNQLNIIQLTIILKCFKFNFNLMSKLLLRILIIKE